MEDDVSFRITSGDKEFEARPDNTSLFMFFGNLASRNHIFIQSDETEETSYGTYLFDGRAEWFDRIAAYMINNGFPAHINLQQVAECDEEAYQRYIDQQVNSEQIEDFFPDDWSNDGAA